MSSKLYMVTCFILIFSSSCVQKRLATNLAERSNEQAITLKTLQKSDQLKDRERLSWAEATRILERENIVLRRGRDQIANARKQRKDQWLALIPKIQGFIGLSQSLSGLAALGSNDIDTRVLASFNIPNPVRFYGQSYALALQSLQAEWSYELTRRQVYIQLYTNFLEERILSERYNEVLKKEKLIGRASIDEISGKITSLAQEKRIIMRTRANQRLALNRLLNTPGHNWKPSGKIPKVSYKNRYENLRFGEKFGKLGLKLQTIQIEASALSILNVKLRQLPNLSQGVSSPVLFSSDQNSQMGLSSDDFFLFASLSKTIDLTNITGKKDLRLAKVRAKYTTDQLRLSMESEIQRLSQLKQSYGRLQIARNKLTGRINYLKKKTDKGVLDTVLKEYEEFQELEEKKQNLDNQITRMDIQFWLWDDVYWNKN